MVKQPSKKQEMLEQVDNIHVEELEQTRHWRRNAADTLFFYIFFWRSGKISWQWHFFFRNYCSCALWSWKFSFWNYAAAAKFPSCRTSYDTGMGKFPPAGELGGCSNKSIFKIKPSAHGLSVTQWGPGRRLTQPPEMAGLILKINYMSAFMVASTFLCYFVCCVACPLSGELCCLHRGRSWLSPRKRKSIKVSFVLRPNEIVSHFYYVFIVERKGKGRQERGGKGWSYLLFK